VHSHPRLQKKPRPFRKPQRRGPAADASRKRNYPLPQNTPVRATSSERNFFLTRACLLRKAKACSGVKEIWNEQSCPTGGAADSKKRNMLDGRGRVRRSGTDYCKEGPHAERKSGKRKPRKPPDPGKISETRRKADSKKGSHYQRSPKPGMMN